MILYLYPLKLILYIMFEKEVGEMNMNELVTYITKKFHEPLRKDIKKLYWLVELINATLTKEYSELSHLQELFNQFKQELLNHITREDFITFPAIIKFERIFTDSLIDVSDNYEVMDKMINDVHMRNEHWDFNAYLNSIIQLLEWSKANWKNIKEFEDTKEIFIEIQKNNIVHTKLENNDLYSKWMIFQKRLRESLNI